MPARTPIKPSKKSVQPVSKARQRELAELRQVLDSLVTEYKTPDYIAPDPISIPYRFVDDPQACELVAFITALFSYGRRDLIIPTVNSLLRIMDEDPVGFVDSFDPVKDAKLFRTFVYRFNKGPDVVTLLDCLTQVRREHDSLERLFVACHQQAAVLAKGSANPSEHLKLAIGLFLDRFVPSIPARQTYGLKFLLAHPVNGGACKRFNMFLRWMVRQDEDPASRVDFGLWRKSLSPADLLIPLDTHVLKMSQLLKLSDRSTGSWQTAEEITAVFRAFCPEDPVRYDYALFGFSLSGRAKDELGAFRLSAG